MNEHHHNPPTESEGGKGLAAKIAAEFSHTPIHEQRKALATAIANAQEPFTLPQVIVKDRNSTLTSYAGQLRRRGAEHKEILQALTMVNNERCQPPLPDAEVARIAQSIATRYSPNPQLLSLRHDSELGITNHVLSQLEQSGEALVADADRLYRYDAKTGVWLEMTRSDWLEIIAPLDAKLIQNTKSSRRVKVGKALVKNTMSLAILTRGKEHYFEHATPGLAFTNGFFSAEAKTIVAHSPTHRSRLCVPWPFNRSREPELWRQTLAEIFEPDTDGELKAELLEEMIGVGLLRCSPRLQMGLGLIGEGANGKSVITDVVTKVFEVCGGVVTAIAPQQLHDQYRRHLLAATSVNICSEMPEYDLLSSAELKAVITGDQLDARQIYGEPYTFRAQALQIFAANTLPTVRDSSHGCWRRFNLLTFNRRFVGEERDPNRARDIIDNELPALLPRLVEKGAAALTRGGYLPIDSSEVRLKEWMVESDPLRYWIDNHCSEPSQHENWTQAQSLYEHYAEWAESTGHRSLSLTKFGRRLATIGIAKRKTRKAALYQLRVVNNFDDNEPSWRHWR